MFFVSSMVFWCWIWLPSIICVPSVTVVYDRQWSWVSQFNRNMSCCIPNYSVLSVPDKGYSRNVPDKGYFRNASCPLNLISTFIFNCSSRKCSRVYWFRYTVHLISNVSFDHFFLAFRISVKYIYTFYILLINQIWNNLYQVRFWNNLYQVRFWNNLYQVRFWNNLYQVRSKIERLETQII
jgi:hypothetical protein